MLIGELLVAAKLASGSQRGAETPDEQRWEAGPEPRRAWRY